MSYLYDAFLSYSREDEERVATVANHLERAGFKVWKDDNAIRFGRTFTREIRDGVLSSRFLLVFWSRAAASSDWMEFERTLILAHDPLNRTGRVLPLLLEDSTLPDDLAHLQYFDFSKKEVSSVDALVATIEKSLSETATAPPHDWGDSGLENPPLSFWGRGEEIMKLRRWLLEERCKIVSITGLGGIGKTTLLKTLLQDPALRRRYAVFARKLLNPLPLNQILAQAISHLSGGSTTAGDADPKSLIRQLVDRLHERPALIILDNLETLLGDADSRQTFGQDFADLELFFERCAASGHESCLLLTCREDLPTLTRLAAMGTTTREIRLRGVSLAEGRRFFEGKGDFHGTDDEWRRLVNLYQGHPYALQLAAGIIAEVFSFDIGELLRSDVSLMTEIEELLDWHLGRLNSAEEEVIYWLAISRQPMRLDELREDLLTEQGRRNLPTTLQSLQRKISLEVLERAFSLQPVMVEHLTRRLVDLITARLVETITDELLGDEPNVLNSHALIRTQSNHYVREAQRRLLVCRILDAVTFRLPPSESAETRLLEILSSMGRDRGSRPGYAPGNLLNMLLALDFDLRGRSFAGLTFWQANLQEAQLQGVDFSDCNFSRCLFAQTFGNLQSIAYREDEGLVAAADTHGRIHVWRLVDQQRVFTGEGHENWVRCVLFVSARRLVSSGDDHTIRLWDLATNHCLRVMRGHTNWVRHLAVHETSNLLASASDDGTVRLWDLGDDTEPLLHTFNTDSGGLRAVAFRDDGLEIACGGLDGSVRFFSPLTRKARPPLLTGHGSVSALCYTESGSRLITAGDDGRLRTWNPELATMIAQSDQRSKAILSVSAGPASTPIVSAGKDAAIRLWSADLEDCRTTLQGHRDWIWSLALSQDGSTLFSAGDDQSWRIWDLASGECIQHIEGHAQVVWAVAFSTDGELLASGHDDKLVRVWDLRTGSIHSTLAGHQRWVQGVAFHPKGEVLASASADGTIRLWDLTNATCLHVLDEHRSWVVSVDFSSNGRHLASASKDSSVRIWDPASGRCLKILDEHNYWVWAVRFSPCGRFLASSSEDRTVLVWDVSTWKLITRLEGHRKGVWGLAWSPDGSHIVSGGVDDSLCLWEASGGALLHRFEEAGPWVGGLSFHPDGHLIASGGGDSTVRLWDAAAKKPDKILAGHRSWVWSVAWSPDGCRLASGSQDETIRLWDPSSGRNQVLRAPRPYESMLLRGAKGLTEQERRNLQALGATLG